MPPSKQAQAQVMQRAIAKAPQDSDDTYEGRSAPLNAFTRFPDLPKELRLMIWKLVMPPHRRMISVSLKGPKQAENFKPGPGRYLCPQYEFAYDYYDFANPWQDSANLTLLGVCRESRSEYLMKHPNFFPTIYEGRIYYDSQSTIIHIANWNQFLGHHGKLLTKFIRNATQLPSWFSEIERLAVSPFALSLQSPIFGRPKRELQSEESGKDQDFSNIHIFRNLKEVIALSIGSNPRSFEKRVSYHRLTLVDFKHTLQLYKARNPAYNIPRISFMDWIIGGDDRGYYDRHDRYVDNGTPGLCVEF